MNVNPVTNVSVIDEITLVSLDKVPNNTKIFAEIFTALANENINIDMISQTSPYKGHLKVSFTISDHDLSKAIHILGKFRTTIPELRTEVNSNNCKLSVYGEAMKHIPGVAAKIFTLLSENNIEIKLVTTSEVEISCLIDEKDAETAEAAIRKAFNI